MRLLRSSSEVYALNVSSLPYGVFKRLFYAVKKALLISVFSSVVRVLVGILLGRLKGNRKRVSTLRCRRPSL